MASSSSSTLIMSKLEFPLPFFSHRRKKRLPSSIPFHCRIHDYSCNKFLISQTTTKLRHSKFGGLLLCALSSSVDDAEKANIPQVEVKTSMWNWRGYSIRYQYAGSSGPALVLVHGFGANSDHWRKNLPVLAQSHRVFSIDLIGYGYSDKPSPRELQVENFYTFETWGSQLNDFCMDVVKDEAFFICNSIGGVVGLQAAVTQPQLCKGIVLFNVSLRMLHITKQPWYGKPLIKSFQNLLRNTALGKFFFKSVATREAVKSILCQQIG